MKVHADAALGPAGRVALCELIDGGMSLRAAAAALNVAPATAHRWWHRRQRASNEQLGSGFWFCDRSSRPRRQPRRLSAIEEERILRARRETGLGPGRLAGVVCRARSTIWKVLHRHGLSRRSSAPRQTGRRYEWSRPGALLHVDTTRLPRFERPGHRVRGRSTQSPQGPPRTRLCLLARLRRRSLPLRLIEQHNDERAETVAGFMRRALEHFEGMTDNGNPYRSLQFRAERAHRCPPDLHPALHATL